MSNYPNYVCFQCGQNGTIIQCRESCFDSQCNYQPICASCDQATDPLCTADRLKTEIKYSRILQENE